MLPKANTDLAHTPQDQFVPVFGAPASCAYCRSGARQPPCVSFADHDDQPGQNDDAKDAAYDQSREDMLVELAVQFLEANGIINNLPASMRLIEHIAESAGYQRAQNSVSTKVTELMLMAARASALADDFRKDL